MALLFSLAAITVSSCKSPSSDKSEDKVTTSASQDDISQNPDYQKGLDLVQKNDCLTCHTVATTATGPSFVDIAKKYGESDVASLAEKVIKGGSGVWGQVPMTPHPNLSKEDAEQIVKYILLLKNQE